MQFIQAKNPNSGIEKLSHIIVENLKAGKKMLWLVPGGSNIPISVQIVDNVRKSIDEGMLRNLTVSLTDERYGEVGHANSNWKQLSDVGFNFHGIANIPVLMGKSIEETTREYAENISAAINSADIVIAQFGIGADGHIAGILPDSPACEASGTATSYHTEEYDRITLTFEALKKIDIAFAFVFGTNKKEAMAKLRKWDNGLNLLPSAVLWHISQATVFIGQ